MTDTTPAAVVTSKRLLPTQIILRPRTTEKTVGLRAANTYTFDVHPDANKTEIKEAITLLFKVKVKRVNTINRAGKARRVGRSTGTTPAIKKAMVTLHDGEKIEGI